MQHRRPASELEVQQMKKVVDVLRKNQFDPTAQKAEADMGTYKMPDGTFYIPFDQIQEAMRKAASSIQLGGQGKKTYKDSIKASVFATDDKIPLKSPGYIVDSRYVKVQRNGVLRNRPRFDEWGAEFQIQVSDDTLDLAKIKEILEKAGTEKGIGDYRLPYGTFEVKKFQEMKGKK